MVTSYNSEPRFSIKLAANWNSAQHTVRWPQLASARSPRPSLPLGHSPDTLNPAESVSGLFSRQLRLRPRCPADWAFRCAPVPPTAGPLTRRHKKTSGSKSRPGAEARRSGGEGGVAVGGRREARLPSPCRVAAHPCRVAVLPCRVVVRRGDEWLTGVCRVARSGSPQTTLSSVQPSGAAVWCG